MGLGKKLISGEQGQAVVEFSFICVILLMLFGGVADCVNIMRYHIALSGAATEVVNQISATTLEKTEMNALCKKVITTNFGNSLGDGDTNYSCTQGKRVTAQVTVNMPYYYHDKANIWEGSRAYTPIVVTLEREQVLFTPFGQLVFGSPGNGGRRHMEATAQTRVYMDRESW